MLFIPLFIYIIESLMVVITSLLSVAYVTIVERNTMASMQRRLGPNIVGFYGLLQPFADALKLLLKEYVSPTQANMIVFFLGPIVTLVFSLLSLAVIPFAPGLSLSDFDLAVLYLLAVSSLSTYGILLAGWSANSKYAFLGSLRSTAQLISYELVLSSIILIIVMTTSSLNFTVIVECQKAAWFMLPLIPVSGIFFIGAVAETNRAPFDLAEAESELVSGFMTEHSSVIFVFFFLAEYASLVVICIVITLLFLGGYNLNTTFFIYINQLAFDTVISTFTILFYINLYFTVVYINIFTTIGNALFMLIDVNNNGFVFSILIEFVVSNYYSYFDTLADFSAEYFSYHYLIEQKIVSLFTGLDRENFISSLVIAFKTFIIIFAFIWVRASYPRIRFDQLMTYCWTILLPLVFAFLVGTPCLLYIMDIMANNALYFIMPVLNKKIKVLV